MKLKDFFAITVAVLVAVNITLASTLLVVDAEQASGLVDVSVIQATVAQGATLGLLFGIAIGLLFSAKRG